MQWPHQVVGNISVLSKAIGLGLLIGLAFAKAAAADDECRQPSAECVAVGGWNFSVALGAGVRTNPLVNGQDLPLVVVPQVSYYGNRFFLDNLDLGYSFFDGDRSTVSLIASPGYDRVYFYRSDLQNIFVGGFGGNANLAAPSTPERVPARSRKVTYLAGPEWTFKYHGITGQLDVLQEITGQKGQEVRAAIGTPVAMPKGTLTGNVGFTWKSANVVNYFYGAPGIYDAGSAFDPFLKVGYTLPLSSKWRFNAFAQYEHLSNAIADSPIIADRYVATVFVGAIYAY
jgi:outer membrane protein